MWDYTEKVMDHFMNPRNVGKLEDADGVGEVGSMSCGDALRLMFKLDDDQKISEAKFQTFGCGSAIASSSILTEMIIGKTLEEASKITNENIADELGGLPREKMHCSVMGREALEEAMIDYYTKQGKEIPCTLIKQDVEICHCFQVKTSTVRNAVLQYKLKDIEDVTHYTKAGGGCKQCHHDIQHVIDNCWEEMGSGLIQLDSKPVDNGDSELIRELLENDIARALRTDGGDIELVEIRGKEVHVRMIGACASCPSSQATIKGWVEAQLKENVDPDITVVEVKK